MVGLVSTYIEHFTYLGLFVVLMLCGLGMPIPEEVAIVLAGVLSAEEKLYWGWALLACLVGALLGDSVMYLIGRQVGAHAVDHTLHVDRHQVSVRRAGELHAHHRHPE